MNLCSRFHQIKDLENPCEIPVSTLSALCLSIVVLVAVECHALKRCTPDGETFHKYKRSLMAPFYIWIGLPIS